MIKVAIEKGEDIVERVYRCGAGGSMRACHAAGTSSISGRDKFHWWGFFGFFSPVIQTPGSFRSPWFLECHLAIIIILIISALLDWVSEWCVSSLMFVLSRRCPGIELITHPGSPSMSLCGQKLMYVIQSRFPLPTGRGSVRPGRRESRKMHL